MEFRAIGQLKAELDKLEEAKSILDEIWAIGGPYQPKIEIPCELMRRIQRFYDFDDSE